MVMATPEVVNQLSQTPLLLPICKNSNLLRSLISSFSERKFRIQRALIMVITTINIITKVTHFRVEVVEVQVDIYFHILLLVTYQVPEVAIRRHFFLLLLQPKLGQF